MGSFASMSACGRRKFAVFMATMDEQDKLVKNGGLRQV
jgi:hypothetical protein